VQVDQRELPRLPRPGGDVHDRRVDAQEFAFIVEREAHGPVGPVIGGVQVEPAALPDEVIDRRDLRSRVTARDPEGKRVAAFEAQHRPGAGDHRLPVVRFELVEAPELRAAVERHLEQAVVHLHDP
jgi:hypothetical protein